MNRILGREAALGGFFFIGIKLTKIVIGVILILVSSSTAYADNHLTETRYCGEPKRTASGKIRRDYAVIREFEKLYPLPAGEDRSKWQIDHVIPLAMGGCDAVRNMQWLPEAIKTCASDTCKDRWERSGIYRRKDK